MQLNKLIEEHGLKSIMERTRISTENIVQLANREFSKMPNVRIIGFISIIEREYETTLGALRDEYREFCEPTKVTKDTSITLNSSDTQKSSIGLKTPQPKKSKKSPKIFKKLDTFKSSKEIVKHGKNRISKSLLVGIILMIGYLAWYFLGNSDQSSNIPDTSKPKTETVGFFEAAVDRTKSWLNQNGFFVTKGSTDVPAKSDTIWTDDESGAPATSKTTYSNDTTDEEPAVEEVDPDDAPAVDNTTVDSTVDDMPAVEAPEVLSPSVPSLEVESSEEESIKKVKPIGEEKPKNSTNKIVIFHPYRNVWVGYTKLDTMKRMSLTTGEDITFDTSEGEWIMTTAHGGVDFLNDGKEMQVSQRGKNYFHIKNGRSKQISHEKFQELNKNTIW